MDNEEKTPQNTAPESGAQPAGNRSSTVGSEGSRYDSGSTQASHEDPDRLENQESGAARGEFGAHGHQGHTHGGYGNQARVLTDPIKQEDQLQTGGAPDGYQARTGNGDQGEGMGGSGSQQNDNGSGPGLGQGFSVDYGNTSGGSPLPAGAPAATAGTGRNQREDDHSSRGGYDNQGHPDDSTYRQPTVAADMGTLTSSAQDEAGRSAAPPEEPNAGAGSSYSGSSSEGHGSRGGSYNDEYDAADDNSQSGSPARGDYDSQDQSRNYGQDSRAQNRPADSDEPDYGATPRRTGSHDGEK